MIFPSQYTDCPSCLTGGDICTEPDLQAVERRLSVKDSHFAVLSTKVQLRFVVVAVVSVVNQPAQACENVCVCDDFNV